MPKLNPRIVSFVLTLVYILAIQAGYYLTAGIAVSTNGLLLLFIKPPYRQRLLGAVSLAAGIFLVAFALGFLTAAVTTRQMALYVGLALLIVGLQVARHMPKHRKLGLLMATIGALLVAYGLGYFG